ncbi:hypothetical protein SeMB42_g07022 [Synchytrium endobioticum]|uniref:Uncharacterized protein n=1 Tax=Synchytrium endobioticum TaxID=286115 RepID=A0A507CFW3_9FUNG|nr:hypothetical protein SeMB42_g07022 [Synchytrium endobioticum]
MSKMASAPVGDAMSTCPGCSPQLREVEGSSLPEPPPTTMREAQSRALSMSVRSQQGQIHVYLEALTHLANDVAALDQTAVPLDIETNTGILPATIPAPFDIANNTPIELIAGHNLASYVVANIWSRDDAVQILHQFQIPHVHTDIIADHDDDEDDALPTSLRITPELARRMLTSFIAEAYERCLRKYRETLSDGNVPSSSNAARMYNLALEYCRDYATIGYLAYLKLSSNASIII